MYGEAGLEFKMPIHRVMSSKDEYGKNDDTGAGLLTFGLSRDKRRAYKCALREIEGAYEKGKEPSVKGLAEAKDFGKKKRKADEEAPEDIKAVPAEEMAALVFKMKTYAGAAHCVPKASRVVTVSTWAPAYFEAVLTRALNSLRAGRLSPCAQANEPRPQQVDDRQRRDGGRALPARRRARPARV